jgi:EAL domain-containing protein (putative c-di-GMP-specific phosphodiesterase class I)/GGDEF domain-containing protein
VRWPVDEVAPFRCETAAMTTSFRLTPVALPSDDVPAPGERFTRTLVELTRTVWHPDCTFDTALAAICAAAASALQLGRVSAWRHDTDAGELSCLCTFDLDGDATVDRDAVLPLADYAEALADVRTYEALEVEGEQTQAAPGAALRNYLKGHRIRSLLYAPAFLDGELVGVLCHESVDRVRSWTHEEITFAGSMGDYMAMAQEIARRRRAEAEVEHLRLHDADTGLGNRDYMVELLRQRLESPRHAGEALAVVHLHVDASGGIAWPAGSPTSDEVMARIAHELRGFGSDRIDLARVRANAFSFVLATGSRQRSVIALAERALAAVRGLVWAHPEVDPSASAGIVFAEPGAESDARVLLRQAEEAAAQAGTGDKFGYVVFDHAHHDVLVEALRFERALRAAFAEGHFEVHYQPEYDAHTGQWVAAESLLRWRDGDRLVVAGEFIGVVESSGLMLPVGRWVLQQACRDAVNWPLLPDGSAPTVRVNVSARQFDEGGLLDDVNAALRDSGLSPARLCLELTETTLMRDIEHALDVLERLKSVGVQVAIDDFGTGYASLVYLRKLPVDVLKIDRSFVEGMPGAVADTAIVKAVVGLAGSLGIDVIAEGVERLAQQQALQAIGVRRMQGWLYGKAVDQASLCQLLGAVATPTAA